MRIIHVMLLVMLISCDIDQSQVKKELQQDIFFFDRHRSQYDLIIKELKNNDLLIAPQTLDTLDLSHYTSMLLKLSKSLSIQKIKYGRIWTCEANGDYNRELFLELNDSVDIWYCPCIDQSDQDHFHNNEGLRGYKGHDKFFSIGRGWNWAIVKRYE